MTLACPRCGHPVETGANAALCRSCSVTYPEVGGILRLTTGRGGPTGYDPHYFTTLPQVEDEHFWFVSRRELILDVLRRSVPDLKERDLVEIGCGSGGLLSFLERSGIRVGGACDVYLQALELARGRTQASLVLVDERPLPPLGTGQSLIGLFDVLEHVDDDQGTLAGLFSLLAPGGILALTVPAHPFLFDEMDALACHRRRYARRELKEKLSRAGFEVRFLSHFMAPLVPLLVLLRPLARRIGGGASHRRDAELRIVPGLNGFLLWLLRVEKRILHLSSLPWGSSLIAIAARPGRSAA